MCTVNSFKCKVILISLLLTLVIAVPVLTQTIKDADDGTTLKQIIILGKRAIGIGQGHIGSDQCSIIAGRKRSRLSV